MLALTPTAADAIETILAAPGMPDSAGVRISPHVTRENGREDPRGSELELGVTEAPVEGDEVVVAEGARVYLDGMVAGALDGMVLDARVDDRGVTFTLGALPGEDS